MKTVYLLCGLPGSGKSTWAKEKVNEDPDTIIICKDNIREMIKGEYIFDKYYEDLVEVFSTEMIFNALEHDFSVIVDETFITKKKRMDLIRFIIDDVGIFSSDPINFVCIYCSSQEGNLERRVAENKGYSKEVWQDVIEKMKINFEIPELNEGFSEIIEVKI